MPAESLQTDAFILLKRPPADSFQSFNAFSPEHGALLILQRLPGRSAGKSVMLDLFDEASLLLESSNQGRSWFVREARVIERHKKIGRSYDSLRLASSLATLIARNTVDAESRRAVGELLRAAFAAFARTDRPDIVYFKSVYRFARDEGYPMKQEWFSSLAPHDRHDVSTLLGQPVSEQSVPPPTVARLQRQLEDYLRGHTEILI